MSALTTLLRRQAEQNPSASYFNVDILKYQIKCKEGAGSCPFQLVAYWKCETNHTDLKVVLAILALIFFLALITKRPNLARGCKSIVNQFVFFFVLSFRSITNIIVALWPRRARC